MSVDLDIRLRVPHAQEALCYAQRRIDRLRDRAPHGTRYTVRVARPRGRGPRAAIEARVEVGGARPVRATAAAPDGQALLALRDAFDSVEHRLDIDAARGPGAHSERPPRPSPVSAS